MKRIVFIITTSLCILAGCQQEVFFDGDREVTVSFSTQSLTSSFTKSAANSAEELVNHLFLFGVDAQGEVIQNIPVSANPLSNGMKLTLSKKVKSLYAIANSASDLISIHPSNLSDLMDMTCDFSVAPQSPFLLSGKAEVNGNNIQVELVRVVAKVEVISKNEFQIQSVTVKNSPDKGYVFKKEVPAAPASAGIVTYIALDSANPVLYVPENSKENPTQFVVTGTYLGKQANYTIDLTIGGATVDIVRNTHYQVSISAKTETDCSFDVSIPEWNDMTADKQVITLPKPPNPYKNGIKILAIGNSYSENSLQYMFDLLRISGVTGDIKLMVAYISGGSLSDHANNVRNNKYTNLTRRIYNANGSSTNSSSGAYTLLQMIQEEPWDIITLQQASASSGQPATYDTHLEFLMDYVKTNKTNPNFKFGWHMTWAWGSGNYSGSSYSNQLDMYTKICNAVKTKIVPKGFDFIIPTGTAIQNARATELFGNTLNVSDGTHLNNHGHYISTATWLKTITGYDFSNFTVPYKNNGHGWGGSVITIDATMRSKIAQAVNSAYETPGYQ